MIFNNIRRICSVFINEQHAGNFNLDGNSELQVLLLHLKFEFHSGVSRTDISIFSNKDETEQVDVSAPTPGSLVQVVIQVTNSSNSLILHWGGIRDGQK